MNAPLWPPLPRVILKFGGFATDRGAQIEKRVQRGCKAGMIWLTYIVVNPTKTSTFRVAFNHSPHGKLGVQGLKALSSCPKGSII
jgi:hypothetical protein